MELLRYISELEDWQMLLFLNQLYEFFYSIDGQKILNDFEMIKFKGEEHEEQGK